MGRDAVRQHGVECVLTMIYVPAARLNDCLITARLFQISASRTRQSPFPGVPPSLPPGFRQASWDPT